jgi:hypothetical protein
MSFGEGGPRGPWDVAGIHGLQRAREWDVVVTAEAPALEGERAVFVALPDGTLVPEEGTEDVQRLAEALDVELARPYRAEAVRRDAKLWAVAGTAIDTARLAGLAGSEVELVSHQGETTLTVDGEPAAGTIEALEREGHAVSARRIHGDVWEVEANPL